MFLVEKKQSLFCTYELNTRSLVERRFRRKTNQTYRLYARATDYVYTDDSFYEYVEYMTL